MVDDLSEDLIFAFAGIYVYSSDSYDYWPDSREISSLSLSLLLPIGFSV